MKKKLKKLRFSAPYQWEDRFFLVFHFIFVLIASAILFFAIYTYSLIQFYSEITINDWPMPQKGSKNATFYCSTENDCEVLSLFEKDLLGIMPTIFDLVIFSLSLSIDSICFGGKPNKLRYYYSVFALIKNLFSIVLILKRAEFSDMKLESLGLFNSDSYKKIMDASTFFQWVYGVLLKFAPIWSLHNLLFLPTVIAFVKFYKNVQDLKYYFNVKAKKKLLGKLILCLLQTTYKILFFLLIGYTIGSCIIAIIIGIGLGILVVPLIFATVVLFSALLSFPFHLLVIYFQKPKKILSKETLLKQPLNPENQEEVLINKQDCQENANEEIEEAEEREAVEEEIKSLTEMAQQKLLHMVLSEEENSEKKDIMDNKIDRKSLNWREINKRLILQRQTNFSLIKNGIILCYCGLACQIIFFEVFNWKTTMKFMFSMPFLGFNVYRFDVGTNWDNTIALLTFFLNLI